MFQAKVTLTLVRYVDIQISWIIFLKSELISNLICATEVLYIIIVKMVCPQILE